MRATVYFAASRIMPSAPSAREPLRIERDLGLVAIENQEHLVGVRLGVGRRSPRAVSGGRVTLRPVGSPIMPVKSPIRKMM